MSTDAMPTSGAAVPEVAPAEAPQPAVADTKATTTFPELAEQDQADQQAGPVVSSALAVGGVPALADVLLVVGHTTGVTGLAVAGALAAAGAGGAVLLRRRPDAEQLQARQDAKTQKRNERADKAFARFADRAARRAAGAGRTGGVGSGAGRTGGAAGRRGGGALGRLGRKSGSGAGSARSGGLGRLSRRGGPAAGSAQGRGAGSAQGRAGSGRAGGVLGRLGRKSGSGAGSAGGATRSGALGRLLGRNRGGAGAAGGGSRGRAGSGSTRTGRLMGGLGRGAAAAGRGLGRGAGAVGRTVAAHTRRAAPGVQAGFSRLWALIRGRSAQQGSDPAQPDEQAPAGPSPDEQRRELAQRQAARAAAAAGQSFVGTNLGGHTMSHPFRPIVEAAASSARWTPENARAVIAWYEGLEQMIEACAQTVTAHGRALNDDFEIDSSAGEQAGMLGSQLDRMRAYVADAQSTFFRQHAEMIARLDSSHPHAQKWDVSANRD